RWGGRSGFSSRRRAAAQFPAALLTPPKGVSSAEAGGFQGIVGLDDGGAGPPPEAATPAVGVGVEALHQGLVLRLDGGSVGRIVEPEHVEGLADRAAVAPALRLRRGAPGLVDTPRAPG